MKKKTNCKECKGWYNSCSPDFYPDYVTDPEQCECFESIKKTCPECNREGAADKAAGGGQIADTGDYDNVYCPNCNRVLEPDDCDVCNGTGQVQVEKEKKSE